MKKIRIYMPLLNEGTNVVRPVVACIMESNIYKILGTKQGLTPEDLDEDGYILLEVSYIVKQNRM
jgi:hypothetical protein